MRRLHSRAPTGFTVSGQMQNENDGMAMEEQASYRTLCGSRAVTERLGEVSAYHRPAVHKPALQKFRLSCRLTPSYMAFVSVLLGSSSARYWSIA